MVINRRDFLGLAVLSCCGYLFGETNDTDPQAPIMLDEVRRAIELSRNYLINACGDDGRFVYRVNLKTGEISNQYNVVRHAGVMYALDLLQAYEPEPGTRAALLRAAGYLRKNYLGPAPAPETLAVWSDPDTKNIAELGGSGLGLVALTAAHRIDTSVVPLSELHALGRFVVFLQADDGRFTCKYLASTGSVQNWESLYYPGEAALGLIYLYELDANPQWLTSASKAIANLVEKRKGEATVPADHWALIASARLVPHLREKSCAISRDSLETHAAQICKSIMNEQRLHDSAPAIDGSFDPHGRIAPAATRLEGLLAALSFVSSVELRAKLISHISRGIRFLVEHQISEGTFAGALPGSAISRNAVRIDFVQHAISAFVGYAKICF